MKNVFNYRRFIGIGKELARQLSLDGIDVFGTYHDTIVPPEDGVGLSSYLG